MKKLFITAAAVAALFSTAANAAPNACDVFADTMTKRVMTLLHDTKTTEEQKRDQLAATFQEAVDTDWIGKFVVGRYWAAASDADKKEYLASYRNYLTLVYTSKFDEEAGMSVSDIKVAGISPHDDNTFDAKTLIIRKGEENVKADYLLALVGNKCQVHDIKIEGVSLLTSQRSEFGALASQSGLKGVTEAMNKRLAAATK